MKTCRACKVPKDLSEFFRDKGLKDGRANTCKDCKTLKTYAWRAANQNEYNAYMRKKNKEAYPHARLVRYGVSRDWYEATLKAQDYKCALCRKLNPSTKRCLAVDHCHETGKVRGILCYGCNRLMALLDDPELFERAVAYKKAG